MAVSIAIGITQNSQSVANNTSNVTVTVTCSWTYGSWDHLGSTKYVTINGTNYYFSSEKINSSKTTSGSNTLFTKTLNIAHGSDGTKTLSCSASVTTSTSSGTVTASASKTLTTIARASSLSVSNGTLGTAQTLTVTRKSTSFTHTITYTCGTASGTVCTKSTANPSFTPPLSLASQNTTSTTVNVTFSLQTYSGDTKIGSAVSKTVTMTMPASVKPSCKVAVTDPTGYLSTFGGYVKNKSKMKVTVTPTTSYSSAISSYSIAANGSTYTSTPATTGVVKTVGSNSITATVKDKRGRSSDTASASVTVLDYSDPKATLNVYRCNSDGTENILGSYCIAYYTASVTSLSSKNTKSLVLKYKKSSDSSYTSVTLTMDSYSVSSSYIFAAKDDSSYNVEVSVTDYFSTNKVSTNLSTAYALFHFNASGKGLGVGKLSEGDGLQIGMDITHPMNMTKQLTKDGVASKWIQGRDNALVRTKSISGNSPIMSVKTTNGTWDVSAYDTSEYTDHLVFSFGTDANYNAGTNETYRCALVPNKDDVAGCDLILTAGNTADRIVEQYASGSWTCIKLNNGLAACFCTYATTRTFPNAYCGQYESGSNITLSFPSGFFNSIIYANVSARTSNGAWPENITYDTTGISFYVFNVVKQTSAINVNGGAIAIGRWK